MDKYCFGIDLGGTTVKIGFFNLEGKIIDKWEIITRKENQGAYILNDIADAIKLYMDEHDVVAEDVIGIGMGVPGPVLKESIVNRCVNLGWDVINVSEQLSALTGLPVKVANDANVAALGEQWMGGGAGFNSMVLITLGTGVGGGIINEGKIIEGATGAGGEIGHINIVAPEDIRGICGCGHTGCLEQAASATGIVNLAKIEMERNTIDSVLRTIENLTAKDVLDAAKAGDELALIVAGRVFGYLGKAAAHIACVINPEVFVIGGGVSKAGEFLIHGIKEIYEGIVFHASKDTPFKLATLGNDAGIYGAARLICK